MAIDDEICADYFSPTKPKYYRLPETSALPETHIKHEHLRAQLYVALQLTGLLGTWEICTDKDEFGLKPDAQCVYAGKVVFWEIDRGTEDYKVIKWKLDRYLQKSIANRNIRFYVGFTTVRQNDRFGKTKRTAEARGRGILELIDAYRRDDQFFVTTHDFAIKYPDSASYSTYLNPVGIAIKDMK